MSERIERIRMERDQLRRLEELFARDGLLGFADALGRRAAELEKRLGLLPDSARVKAAPPAPAGAAPGRDETILVWPQEDKTVFDPNPPGARIQDETILVGGEPMKDETILVTPEQAS